MSPAFWTTCVRCERVACRAGCWPDGPVCRTCHDRALRIRGRCPDCGAERVLPGRRPTDHEPICRDCAGITVSFRCRRCGNEGKLHAGRLCTRCTFSDKLTELLDDGTGRIRPDLVPLAEHLLAMNNPLTGLTWLYPRGRVRTAADLLRELGRGEIELTHEAFHTLQPWRAATHLRELLMACGILPRIDKQLCSLERWLAGHLADISDPERAQLVRRFATWEVLPRLRRRAENKPLTPAIRRHGGDQIKRATAFLGWLADRELTLATCGQADIDVWFLEHSIHTRNSVRPFLSWCMDRKLTRRFRLPVAVSREGTALPQQQRIELLGRLLVEHDKPLRARVAASIVLLYAQPFTRIVRLTIEDVIVEDEQVLLRLGEPPSPVPGPVAELLLEWIAGRTNMNTATNRESRWLFPGRRAGQPMHPEALSATVRRLGIPNVAARTAALRQLVLEMPAPVVADALGYHYTTTTRSAAQAGGVWSRYAAGPRTRSPQGWKPDTSRNS